MVLGRLIGDRAIAALGPRAVVRVGTSIAALALALGLGLNLPASAIIGFGLLGLGLSVVVPAVLSASGRLPGLAPAPALAMTTAFGWIGFVAGPPFIGLLASVTGLRAALGLLPLLCLIMTALTLVVPMPPLQTQPNISPSQQIACPSKRK
jgi:MFS family permease